ncbi:MAG: hypothetical protein AAF202_13100 [Pseudomonadota bacterium]
MKTGILLSLFVFSASVLSQPASTPSQNLTLVEFKELLAKRSQPTILEINAGLTIVQISEARAIRTFRVTDVRNRVHLAQSLCDPKVPLDFPDGTQGVIICWKNPKLK